MILNIEVPYNFDEPHVAFVKGIVAGRVRSIRVALEGQKDSRETYKAVVTGLEDYMDDLGRTLGVDVRSRAKVVVTVRRRPIHTVNVIVMHPGDVQEYKRSLLDDRPDFWVVD